MLAGALEAAGRTPSPQTDGSRPTHRRLHEQLAHHGEHAGQAHGGAHCGETETGDTYRGAGTHTASPEAALAQAALARERCLSFGPPRLQRAQLLHVIGDGLEEGQVAAGGRGRAQASLWQLGDKAVSLKRCDRKPAEEQIKFQVLTRLRSRQECLK